MRGLGTLCVRTNTSLLYTAQKVRWLNCTGVGDEVGSYRHVRVQLEITYASQCYRMFPPMLQRQVVCRRVKLCWGEIGRVQYNYKQVGECEGSVQKFWVVKGLYKLVGGRACSSLCSDTLSHILRTHHMSPFTHIRLTCYSLLQSCVTATYSICILYKCQCSSYNGIINVCT